MLGAVNVRAELAPLLPEFPDARQREHLEASAVGEYRPVPAVELMQSSSRP